MGQNRPKFRVHYSKKYTSSKKSTPPLVVAVVTNMGYAPDENAPQELPPDGKTEAELLSSAEWGSIEHIDVAGEPITNNLNWLHIVVPSFDLCGWLMTWRKCNVLFLAPSGALIAIPT